MSQPTHAHSGPTYFNNIFEQMPSTEVSPTSEPNIPSSFLPPQPNSAWTATPNPEDNDDENDDEDDDDEDDQKPQPSNGKKRKQELHRRHSKRYRDNLGELFSSLEQLLPRVMPGCKLKTKSQIIANSVSAIKHLRSEVATLEIRYVLSSPANRTKWVEDTVSNAQCFQDVVEPFMRLLLSMQRWKHCEFWARYEMKTLPDGTQTNSPAPKATQSIYDLGPASAKRFFLKLQSTASMHDIVPNSVPASYKRFSEESRGRVFSAGDSSLVGRIATTLSPELIDLRNSECGFHRVELAAKAEFSVCFAVPFLLRGHVFAAVLFYDHQSPPNIGPHMNLAQDLASSLGNCYGAS